ncbi:hypothetical protein [Marinicella sp. W31]|uniref:hypothetical protein n=1 Tax=Marinicella sp. W31 TaxID=3023713 RepID=UPI0037568CA8
MKKTILILLLSLAFTSIAKTNIGLYFDEHGELIPPDQILVARALKQDQDGYKDLAMRYLKEAAAFGNDQAKYFTGLLYIQQKDWINGYAWLKLVHSGTGDIDTLRPKIETLISDDEKQQAELVFQGLKEEYSTIAGFEKRDKWRRSIRPTGSRIGGGKNFRSVNITTGSGAIVQGNQLEKMLDTFTYDYEFNPGQVNIGILELIEEEKQDQQNSEDDQ